MKIGLVVEGGGMKCAYSAGILDKFLDVMKLNPDDDDDFYDDDFLDDEEDEEPVRKSVFRKKSDDDADDMFNDQINV